MREKLSDEWETPPWLWKRLNRVFTFTWDACSTQENNLAGEALDCFDSSNWIGHGNVFMNPPYSNVRPFLTMVGEQAELGYTTVTLIKGDPSTRWWNGLVKDTVHQRRPLAKIRLNVH